MIKRIIFDIDDTLIAFPREYNKAYQTLLNDMNLSISFVDLYNVIDKYETCGKYKYYNINDMIKFINEELNLSLDISFYDKFSSMYDELITPVQSQVKTTLKYLSDKYELVTLSNWFTQSQINRLKKVGILKYFKKVYGADIVPMKPNKECFEKVLDGLKPEECVMIGDNFNTDIKVPYEMGFNVFYYTKENSNYPTLKNISDLREML